MGWRSRAVAFCALAAAAVAAPAAHAAHGTDDAYRGDSVLYTADPGEANRFVAEDDQNSGLHLSDTGAVIHWNAGPRSQCTTTAHDVHCPGSGSPFGLSVDLGDGADTFVNYSVATPMVHLGPGDDKAIGGGDGYVVDGGPGADDLHGTRPSRWSFDRPVVTYWNAKRRVTVTADNKANDGVRGEHDNVHSDVYGVEGSRHGDTIRGFTFESGHKGNDLLQGSRHADMLDGGNGNDVLVGRGGRDWLMDQRGNNVFRARDHSVDHIACGSGHDIVYADRRDVIEPASPPLSGPCDVVHVR